MEKVIDFGALERYIKAIEGIFQENGINQIEQRLVLEQTAARLNRKVEQQKTQDMLENMTGGGLLSGIVKRVIEKGDADEGKE